MIPTTGTLWKRHYPLVSDRSPKHAIVAAAIGGTLLSGCARSPSISVLGAYFPDWLFCIVAGAVLTILAHLILRRLQLDYLLAPSAVVYPTLVAFLSLAVWLLLFQQ